MSSKDMRYYRHCPICKDKLVGTDDGLEVFESLQSQLQAIAEGDDIGTPCCTLCGKECESIEHAAAIVQKSEPKLHKR